MRDVRVDFAGDALEFIRQEMVKEGFPVDGITDLSEGAFQFSRIQHRSIRPRPRETVFAAGVTVPTEHQAGFDALDQASKNGESLKPFRSIGVARLNTNDGMLNDWGIHHFHMGTQAHPKAQGFVSRTGPVVYAKVTDDGLYVLAIDEHGRWSDKDLIEIIHANWPALIASYRVNVVPTQSMSSDDIKALRAANVNALVELRDGTAYMSPGGGNLGSGDAVLARMSGIKFCKMIRGMETAFLERISAGDRTASATHVDDRGQRTHELRMAWGSTGEGVDYEVVDLASGGTVVRLVGDRVDK